MKRYTPDCVYDDQFVYANDRYKMAGQWFALPKLFKESKNEGYQVVRSDDEVLQFRNEQVGFFSSLVLYCGFEGVEHEGEEEIGGDEC